MNNHAIKWRQKEGVRCPREGARGRREGDPEAPASTSSRSRSSTSPSKRRSRSTCTRRTTPAAKVKTGLKSMSLSTSDETHLRRPRAYAGLCARCGMAWERRGLSPTLHRTHPKESKNSAVTRKSPRMTSLSSNSRTNFARPRKRTSCPMPPSRRSSGHRVMKDP